MAQPRRLLHFSCSSKDFKDFSIQELPQPDFTIKERRRTLLWEIYAAIILLVAQAWRRLPHMRARKQASTVGQQAGISCCYVQRKRGASISCIRQQYICGVSKFSNSNIILCRVVYMKKQQHQFICVQCLCDSQVPFIINLALFLMFFIGIICALAVVFGYFPAGRQEWAGRPARRPTTASIQSNIICHLHCYWMARKQPTVIPNCLSF